MYMCIILTRRPLIKLILLLYLFRDAVTFSPIKKAAKCIVLSLEADETVYLKVLVFNVHVCLTGLQVPPQSSNRL